MELEPLSEQHTLLKFLRNVDNSKMLTGFVQELANAITDYQVCLLSLSVIFNMNLWPGFDATRDV